MNNLDNKIISILVDVGFPILMSIVYFLIVFICAIAGFTFEIATILAAIITFGLNLFLTKKILRSELYHMGLMIIGYMLSFYIMYKYESRGFSFIPYLGTYLLSIYFIIPSVVSMIALTGIQLYSKYIKKNG